jgi:hypothetical protein
MSSSKKRPHDNGEHSDSDELDYEPESEDESLNKRPAPDNSAEILDLCQRARQHIANVDIAGFAIHNGIMNGIVIQAMNNVHDAIQAVHDHERILDNLRQAAGMTHQYAPLVQLETQLKGMAYNANRFLIRCEDEKKRLQIYRGTTIPNLIRIALNHTVQASELIEQARELRGDATCIAEVDNEIVVMNRQIDIQEQALRGIAGNGVNQIDLSVHNRRAVLDAIAKISTEVLQITSYHRWANHTFSSLTNSRTNWGIFGANRVTITRVLRNILANEGYLTPAIGPNGGILDVTSTVNGGTGFYFTLDTGVVMQDLIHGSIHHLMNYKQDLSNATAFHARPPTQTPPNPNDPLLYIRTVPATTGHPLYSRTDRDFDETRQTVMDEIRRQGILNLPPPTLIFTCVPNNQVNFRNLGQSVARFVQVMCGVLSAFSGLWQLRGGGRNGMIGIVTICIDICNPTTIDYGLVKTIQIEITLDKDFDADFVLSDENIVNIAVKEIYAIREVQSKLSNILSQLDNETVKYIKSNISRSVKFFNAMVKNIDKIMYTISSKKPQLMQKVGSSGAEDQSIISSQMTQKPITPFNDLTEKKDPQFDHSLLPVSITAGGGNMDIYKGKYLKYKAKYLKLKNSI